METMITTYSPAGAQGLQGRQDGHGPPGAHGHHDPSAAPGVQHNAENLNTAAGPPPDASGHHEDHDRHGHQELHGHQEFSIPEAAVAVGLSISTIRRLIQSGRLPARFERGDKGQHRYFIAVTELARLAALGKAPGLEPMSTHREPMSTHQEPMGTQPAGSPAAAAPAPGAPGHHERQVLSVTDDHGDQGVHGEELHGAHDALAQGLHGRHGLHEAPAAGRPGDHGDLSQDRHGDHGAPGPLAAGTLEQHAAALELAVLRERLAGAQEAVRLHAERVRGQTRDISFLQAQLDRSREAEEQLRVLLARLTAALPAAAPPPALAAAVDVTPAPPGKRRARWWQPWRRGA